jgi:hypothetical protein
MAGALEFIMRFPHGYDEEVGEGGQSAVRRSRSNWSAWRAPCWPARNLHHGRSHQFGGYLNRSAHSARDGNIDERAHQFRGCPSSFHN